MRPALYTGLACVLCASLYGLIKHMAPAARPAGPEAMALRTLSTGMPTAMPPATAPAVTAAVC